MRITRTAGAAGLLVVESGLAVLGVLVHYGFTAEYGDINDSAVESLRSGFSTGVGGAALAIVGLVALAALVVSPQPRMRWVALGIPPLMLLTMFAVTPAALQKKLEVQYDVTPRCLVEGDAGNGPGARAARESQEAFESIDHVGLFGGGGGSGLGGCNRSFVLTEDVDVLQHYRAALREAGWRVVEHDRGHLRAERDRMAFEVSACNEGGVVWAGEVGYVGARCPLG